MDIRVGNRVLKDVDVPLLWGNRAVIQHRLGNLSVIDLGSRPARLEILEDQPAPGVSFAPTISGFRILASPDGPYNYNPKDRTLASWSGNLPDCQIDEQYVRVGESVLGRSATFGADVGPRVTSNRVIFELSLPAELAELIGRGTGDSQPVDGSLLAMVSRNGEGWTREKAEELDQVVLNCVRRYGAPYVFVWIARDLWDAQAPNIRFNLSLSAPGVAWTTGPVGTTTESSYVLYRTDPTKTPVLGDEVAAVSVA